MTLQTLQQPLLIGDFPCVAKRGWDWFTSVSYDQDEILRAISILHNDGKPFECDPTYSQGNFYRNFPQPRLKFDMFPQSPEVQQADCRALPLQNGSVQSIMFDPPFVMSGDAHKENPTGKIATRFTSFANFDELVGLYVPALKEFYRVLELGGLLVFKCQDSVCGGRQYLTHANVISWAQERGFYVKDLFILVSPNLLMDNRWKNQHHARKAHSYFLVFIKQYRGAS